jgi:polyphosphate glucokinase
LVLGAQKIARDWAYDVISIGHSGLVLRNLPISEPHNFGLAWVGFNFEAAFGRPVSATQICQQ